MKYARSPHDLLVAVVGALGLFAARPVTAAVVKGTVNLPAELRDGRVYLGHWRVENTNVAIQHGNQRSGTVVMLVGPPYQAIPPKNVTVEIAGLQATPSAVVVSEGTVVEFKNSDKVSHELSVPGQPQIMPPERLSAGTVRKQRFSTPGEYLVRCAEYPHIVVSVLVTNSPYFSIADDRGAFKINDVPEGKATLKVWSGGRWVKEAEIAIPARGLDLTVKVPNSAGTVEPVEPAKDGAEPGKDNAE
jgi:plastocyanin